MEVFYYLVFGALSAVVAGLELGKSGKDRVATPTAFNAFKNNYVLVYSLMMSGDWLQGPYVYYLYSQYGFDKGDIGRLFIAGFGSSMLFGTIVGSLADRQGRKRACITYCITYILSCITKHSPQYRVLLLGRILGGVATSLLFSAFESWLVAEHNKVPMKLAPNEDKFMEVVRGTGGASLAWQVLLRFIVCLCFFRLSQGSFSSLLGFAGYVRCLFARSDSLFVRWTSVSLNNKLRGRVGRSGREGFTYLFYTDKSLLSRIAMVMLKAYSNINIKCSDHLQLLLAFLQLYRQLGSSMYRFA